jgi:NADPH:quinone reductase-like Zn-dependent oxidoreductase
MKGSMKAVVVHEPGAPSVLKSEQVPVPQAGIGEVLLAVRGCALNHLDVWCRSGLPGVKMPLILGCDVSGEIKELGAGVNNVKVGDKVLVAPGLSCQTCAQCVAGHENLCRFYHILGAGRDGGYAEYVNVPAVNCYPLPRGLSFHQAAAIPLVFMTAWHMLVTRAAIKMGETVLVIGAGSGVGSAAIQIAKLYQCRIIATAGNEEKAKLASELGANEVIIHSKQKIADEVKKLTEKRGVDVIFEHVGPAVFEDCLASLSTGGRLVTCGGTTGAKVEVDIPRLFMKQQTIYGSMMGTKGEMCQWLPLFDKGILRPVVDNVFPLGEAIAAHELLESRRQFGKVVLDPTV